MASRRALDNLIAMMIPEVRSVFLNVMQGIVDDAFIDEMIAAIEAGDQNALFNAVGFTPAALNPILDAIEKVYEKAGQMTGDGFPARIRTPTGSMTFRFDMRNPAVEQQLKEFSSGFVTRLTDEARENVRSVLEQGMMAGANPRTTALDIVGRIDPTTKQRVGGVIGLTNAQEGWVASGRRYLVNLDPKYFTMTLRDQRFDGIVQRAIDSGTPLPAETIEKLLTAYKNRALKYRGDQVAITETTQAFNRAEYQAHKQAITEGALTPDAITKHWDSLGDTHVRHTHAAMDKKYSEVGIAIDEPFVSPSGAKLLYPGDQSLGAPAREIVGCRCRQKYRVDWFAGVE